MKYRIYVSCHKAKKDVSDNEALYINAMCDNEVFKIEQLNKCIGQLICNEKKKEKTRHGK